ncbi:hypothetical protein [Rhizobium leguminosarum]|uniref:hypothetical protein n=1 Tax=Rhizobium leguminosarum TaxID=384 RepID=UPI0014421203|nr:hypothetical protein [Rhizobium leguminosarum]NKL60217.1 hypothetical protein [Rhizobium leguminosarum bv. viciae]
MIATPFRVVDPGRLGALMRHGQRGGAIVVTGKRPIVRLRYTELKRGAGRDVGPPCPTESWVRPGMSVLAPLDPS